MKRLTVILICMALLLFGCGTESAQMQSTMSEQVGDEQSVAMNISDSVFSSETESEIMSNSENIDDTVDNNESEIPEDDQGGVNGLLYFPTYDTWNDVVQNHADEINTNIGKLNGARISELLDTTKITVYINRNCLRFYGCPLSCESPFERPIYDASGCEMNINFRVYYLNDDEVDREPWYYYKRDINDSNMYELDDFNRGIGAYRYTKEGMDIYVVNTSSAERYGVCFKIGRYIFTVSSDFQSIINNPYGNGLEFIPQELYDKLLVGNEQHKVFHELCDFSNEESELVRVLKEMVAEAENSDAVTE